MKVQKYVLLLVLLTLALLILIFFMIIRNRKYRKDLEEKMNRDYRKPKSDEVDSEGKDSV